MTDSPYQNRRQTDSQIESLKEFIEGRFSEHMDNDHVRLSKAKIESLIESAERRAMEHEQLKIDMQRVVHDTGVLLDYVAGEKVIDPFTDQWHGERKGGMYDKQRDILERVEDLERRSNGGGGFSIRNKDKVVIALLATGGSVLVALIQAFG